MLSTKNLWNLTNKKVLGAAIWATHNQLLDQLSGQWARRGLVWTLSQLMPLRVCSHSVPKINSEMTSLRCTTTFTPHRIKLILAFSTKWLQWWTGRILSASTTVALWHLKQTQDLSLDRLQWVTWCAAHLKTCSPILLMGWVYRLRT